MNEIYSEVWNELPDDARRIRENVFMKEQGFDDEFDEIDNHCLHLVMYMVTNQVGSSKADRIPVGTGRLIPDKSSRIYTIGRVAVEKSYRQYHLGSRILEVLEQRAMEEGAIKTMLSAQCSARAFYEKNGYVAFGEEYLDEHCPHIQMEKQLI